MYFSDSMARNWGLMILAGILLAPLGVWKLVEIVIWLVQHTRVVWQ